MNKNSTRQMRGVTLLELMIVVVVIAILAAIAYPNYRQYAARAKRTEAKVALLEITKKQETFYLQNNTFTEDMTLLGFAADPYTSDTGSYRIDVDPGANANFFSATAIYLNGDAEAGKCATFTINATGAKGSGPLADCWTRTR